MLTHYFTLFSLARELDPVLKGGLVHEAFSQQKNELLLHIETGNRDEQWMVASVEPTMNYLYVTERMGRARRNSVDLFPALAGVRITNVIMRDDDRIFDVVMENGLILRMRLFNTARSNILLLNADGTIEEAFKHSAALENTAAGQSGRRGIDETLASEESFQRAIESANEETVGKSIRRALPLFGELYSRELMYRSGVDPISRLHAASVGEIYLRAKEMREELRSPVPSLYSEKGIPKIFAVLALTHVSGLGREQFETVNAGIRSTVSRTFSTRSIRAERDVLEKQLLDVSERLRRNREALTAQMSEADRALEYERMGNILLAHLDRLARGMDHVTLPDMYTDGAGLRIPLESRLSPAQNAERYFDKAKRAKLAREKANEQLRETGKRLSVAERLKEAFQSCAGLKDIQEFTRKHEEELNSLNIVGEKSEEEQLPFRTFVVAGDLEVWVGKSSASNDLLTMKYARPNDLWFHVRGAGGSHTVLRVPKGGDGPPREAIRQAARIAAYYSKMRNAGNVPVAFCEKKYVRKPKGAAEGAVTMQREEVIFVKPGLP